MTPVSLTNNQRILILLSVNAIFDYNRTKTAQLLKRSLDWSSLVRLSLKHKTLPLLAHSIRNRGFDPAMPESMKKILHRLFQVCRISNNLLIENHINTINRLQGEIRRFMTIKGLDVMLRCYPPTLPRMMNDIDMLVQYDELEKVRTLMRELSFLQGIVNEKKVKIERLAENAIRKIEVGHYELLPFYRFIRANDLDPYRNEILRYRPPQIFFKGQKAFFLVEYDFHHNLSIDFDTYDIWKNPYRTTIRDMRTFGQSPDDMIWFYSARLYHEAMIFNNPSLRTFCDILGVLYTYGERIDWKRVQSIAHKYQLQPSLYYVLSHCREFLPHAVPRTLLTRFNPENKEVSGYHDWGDFSAKMFKKSVILEWNLED